MIERSYFDNSDDDVGNTARIGLEHPDMSVGRVGGSNPSAPTPLDTSIDYRRLKVQLRMLKYRV